MRKAIIAGNWKMNKTPAQAAELIEGLIPLCKGANCDVVICPPFVDLCKAVKMTDGTNIHVGAQNVHWAQSGAFTGEVSADMLTSIGVEYVIIGHSERRQYFGETDETVNLRAKAAIAAGLIPIICVGESLAQRESGETDALVTMQINKGLDGIAAADVKKLVIAYEPIWAIGTGKTATDEQANETIGVIRGAVEKLYGHDVSDAVRIQYGGSMKPSNVKGLMAQNEIDGGLIGGASLKAEDFAQLVNYDK
ncbi:MAG: triose-phosphate isomerase [Clostridia bacterium]|nr:triose-phosphate isomerase [Clostridia bacterium]